MLTVTKIFTFDYSHRLKGEDNCFYNKNKCGSLHGHTGTVEITVKQKVLNIGTVVGNAELLEVLKNDKSESADNFGFVMDYAMFKPVKNWIDTNLDHATIVDSHDSDLQAFLEKEGDRMFVMPISRRANSEHLVRLMVTKFHSLLPDWVEIVKLRFWETPKSYCEWTK